MTLGPEHRMELAHYPIGKFYQETGRARDLDDLAHRDDLIDYYKAFTRKLNLENHIRTVVKITKISPSL